MNAVGGQHAGSGLGEYIGVDAAVVGDGNTLAAALGFHPVGKALGGLTDHINIHPVGTGTQYATKACGAEFQSNGETVLDLLVVPGDFLQLPGQSRVFQFRSGPALVIL